MDSAVASTGAAATGAGAGSGSGAASGSGGASAAPASPMVNTTDKEQAVLLYLQKRGFHKIEAAFRSALSEGGSEAADSVTQLPISLGDLANKNAPRDPTGKTGAEAKEKDTMGTVEAAAYEALRLDPTDRTRGFAMVKNWCEGSLDIYLPELRPLLLPLFVNSYLDLVDLGYANAAAAMYQAYSSTFLPTFTSLLSHIRSIVLPSQAGSDALAQRFRTERYVLKISQPVFALLLGWLTDGTGPVGGGGGAEGVGDGAETPARRGREAMMRIINERCRLQVLKLKPYEISPELLEEGTGLTGAGPAYSPVSTFLSASRRSQHHPALVSAAVSTSDAVNDLNAKAAGPLLKLAPAIPMNERLAAEVQRELSAEDRKKQEAKERERMAQAEATGGNGAGDDAMEGVESTAGSKEVKSSRDATPATARARTAVPIGASSAVTSTSAASGGLIAAEISDLPPMPAQHSFRTVDLEREVARIRDARKALRFNLGEKGTPAIAGVPGTAGLPSASLGGSFFSGVRDKTFNALGEEGATMARTAALPSICMYTYHDADDGVTCSTFSEDVSLMAAGFEHSYVQLWSLKGEPLRGLRSDFELSEVRNSKSIRKLRENTTQTTRKLIGHGGPVYSVSFDPVAGTARPPRHLLSSSADGTARLWSLDTFSALVAYKGHQHPVWDVQWGPLGTYFATASADKTARLWTTDRISPLRIYAGHLSDVDCLAFHPNSLYLATGSSDRTCRLWDVQRGACLRLFVGHSTGISSVKISPDGRYLASAGCGDGLSFGASPTAFSGGAGSVGDDAAISLWDLGSGRRVKKMWGHEGRVNDLSFSADGALLVSAGADGTVRVWDVRGAGGAQRGSMRGSLSLEAQQLSAAVADEATGGAGGGAGAGGAAPSRRRSLAGLGGYDDIVGELPLSRSARTRSNRAPLVPSADCVATYRTRNTPVLDAHFTPRNLCLVAGAFDLSS